MSNQNKKNKLISKLIKRRGAQIGRNKLLKNKVNVKKSNNVKSQQELKYIYEENIMNKLNNKDYLRNILIKPVNTKNDKKKIVEKYIEKENKFEGELTEAWRKRTNMPYKNIIKNDDYKKNIKKSDDLIVHKVSAEDKKGVNEKLNKHLKDLNDHDNQLKVIYSTSNEIKHIKKFEYNHKYKFRVRSVNSSHENLKESRMDDLKKEEKSNKEYVIKLDSIINDLKNEGILEENDIL
jgi:hypothetical protein